MFMYFRRYTRYVNVYNLNLFFFKDKMDKVYLFVVEVLSMMRNSSYEKNCMTLYLQKIDVHGKNYSTFVRKKNTFYISLIFKHAGFGIILTRPLKIRYTDVNS